jgi:hypothetical protein
VNIFYQNLMSKGGAMRKRVWNPYLAGAFAGVLLVLSVLIAGKFLGASTTFARSASVIEKGLGIDTSQFEYFTTKKGKYGPGSLPDWQLLFVVGIVIGAFISSKLSGEYRIQMVPDMWRGKFRSSMVKRGLVAFIGGVIALVGARLAGG